MKELNIIYLFINVLLYLTAFIIYQRKRESLNTGSMFLLFYLSVAVVGWHLFFLEESNLLYIDLRLFPYLYLFVLLILFTLPILKLNEENLTVQQPSIKIIIVISIVIILSSLIQVFFLDSFTEGLASIFFDINGGSDLYKDAMEKTDSSGIGIDNIASIISGAFSNISILFLFYLLTVPKKNIIIIVGLIFSIIISLLVSVSNGLRTDIVLKFLTLFFTYILFRTMYSDKVKKVVRVFLFVLLFVISIPVFIITISRFSDTDTVDNNAIYSVEWYYGQSFLNFNNYGLDAGGTRNGDRTANLFKQIIWDDTPRNYIERRDKYSHLMMDDFYFYTFIGDFTIDYGPILGTIILLLLTLLFYYKTRAKDQQLQFHQMIIIFFVLCVCAQGTTYLFSFSDVGGGLNLITFFILYFVFKLDYMSQNKLIKF